jgi:hypothetical protein
LIVETECIAVTPVKMHKKHMYKKHKGQKKQKEQKEQKVVHQYVTPDKKKKGRDIIMASRKRKAELSSRKRFNLNQSINLSHELYRLRMTQLTPPKRQEVKITLQDSAEKYLPVVQVLDPQFVAYLASLCPLAASGRKVLKVHRRAKQKERFCERCSTWYSQTMQKHFNSDRHQRVEQDPTYWLAFDAMVLAFEKQKDIQ